MSYPALPASGAADAEAAIREFLLDIASRKEFRALIPGPASAAAPRAPHPFAFGLPPGPPAPDVPTITGLRLHGAQVFVSSFFSPDTPFTRLLLNWQTGTGKTIGAISIAQEYVRQYRSRVAVPPPERPTVFIIGFTKTIIQAEMLRHPEFGFVSADEVSELWRLHLLAETSGSSASPEARHYSGFIGILNQRITDRTRGGYYRFYGYKEFANRLFSVTRRGAARGFSVAALYCQTTARHQAEKEEESNDDEDEQAAVSAEPTFLERIAAAGKAGVIEVNPEL